MSKSKPTASRGRQRQVRIRSELRKAPDLQKIANTVVAFAMAQAEKEAQSHAASPQQESSK